MRLLNAGVIKAKEVAALDEDDEEEVLNRRRKAIVKGGFNKTESDEDSDF